MEETHDALVPSSGYKCKRPVPGFSEGKGGGRDGREERRKTGRKENRRGGNGRRARGLSKRRDAEEN
jgi:hypothetical protein